MGYVLKASVLTALLLVLPASSFGQAEKALPEGWTGDASLSLSFQRGNSETTNLSFSFSAKRSLALRLELVNTGFFLFTRTNGLTSGESLGASSRMNWKHSSRVFTFYELQGIRDRFKNYDYRILPSVGIGYRVLSSKTTELALHAGLAEVFTKYRETGDTETYAGITMGNRLAWKISETAELTQRLAFNADVSELSRYFIRLEVNLAAALSNRLALKLSFIGNYDHKPVGTGIKKNDTAFLAGVSLKY